MNLLNLKHVYIVAFNPTNTQSMPRDFTVSIGKNQPALIITQANEKLHFSLYRQNELSPITLAPSRDDITRFNTQIASINAKVSASGRVKHPTESEKIIKLCQEILNKENDSTSSESDDSELESEVSPFTQNTLPLFLKKNLEEIEAQEENDPGLIHLVTYLKNLDLEQKTTVMATISRYILQSTHSNKDLWMQSYVKCLLPGEQEQRANDLTQILSIEDKQEKNTQLMTFITTLTHTASDNQIPITLLLGQCDHIQTAHLFQEIYPIFQQYHKEKQTRIKQYISAYHHPEQFVVIKEGETEEKHKEQVARILNGYELISNRIQNANKTLQTLEFFIKSLACEKDAKNISILEYLQQPSSHSSPAVQQTINEYSTLKIVAAIYQPLENHEKALQEYATLISLLQNPNILTSLENEGASFKQCIDALKRYQLYLMHAADQLSQAKNKTYTAEQQQTADDFILDILQTVETACTTNPQAQNMLSSYYYNALLEYIYDEVTQFNLSLGHTITTEFSFDIIKNANKLPQDAWYNVILSSPLENLQDIASRINILLLHIVKNNKLNDLLDILSNNTDEAAQDKMRFLFEKILAMLIETKPELSETTCSKLINSSLSHSGNIDDVLKLLAAYPKNETKSNLFNAIIQSPVYTAYLINTPEEHIYLWKQLGETLTALPSDANHPVPYTPERIKINHWILAKYFSQLSAENFSTLSHDVQGRFKYFNAALLPATLLKQLSRVLKEQIILSFQHPSTFTRSLVFEDSVLFNAITTGFTSEEMQKFFRIFLGNQCLEATNPIEQPHQHNIMTAFFRYFKERNQETVFWNCFQEIIPQAQQKNCIHTYIFSNRTFMEALADVGEDAFWKLAVHDFGRVANSVNSWMGYEIKPDRYQVLTLELLTPLIEYYNISPSEATEKVLSDWLLLQFKHAINTSTAEETRAEIELTSLQMNRMISAFEIEKNISAWSQLLGNPTFQQAWKLKYPLLANNLERLAKQLYPPLYSIKYQAVTESLSTPFYNQYKTTQEKFILSAANESINLSANESLEQMTAETQSHFGPILKDKITGSIKLLDYALIHSAKRMRNANDAEIQAWKKLFEDYVGSLRRALAENETPVDRNKKELPEIRKTIAYALGGSQSRHENIKQLANDALNILLTPKHLLYFKQLYENAPVNTDIQDEIKQIIRMMFMANAPHFLKTLATPSRKLEWDWALKDILGIENTLTAKEVPNITQAWWHGIDGTSLKTCREIAGAREFEAEQQFKRSGSLKSGGWSASAQRAKIYSGTVNNPKIRSRWFYATSQYIRAKLGMSTTDLKSEHIDKSWREVTPIHYSVKPTKEAQFLKAKERKTAFLNIIKQHNTSILENENEIRKDRYVDTRPSVKESNTKARVHQYLNQFLASQNKNDTHDIQALKTHLTLKPWTDLNNVAQESETMHASLTDMEAILKVVSLGDSQQTSTKINDTVYNRSSDSTLAWWYYQTIGRYYGEKGVTNNHLTPLKAMLVEMTITEQSSDNPLLNSILTIVRGESTATTSSASLTHDIVENTEIITPLEKIITESSATIEKYMQLLENNKSLDSASYTTLTLLLTQAVSTAVRIQRLSHDSNTTAIKKTSEWCARLQAMKTKPMIKNLLTHIEFQCANVPEYLSLSRIQSLLITKQALLADTQKEMSSASTIVVTLEQEIKDLETSARMIKSRIASIYPRMEGAMQTQTHSPLGIFAGSIQKNTLNPALASSNTTA